MVRAIAAALIAACLTGCAPSGPAGSPGAAAPGTTAGGSPASTIAARTPGSTRAPIDIPIGSFAALREDPLPAATAAKLERALAGTVPQGAIAATVFSPAGAWRGASGTADGIHDLEVDSQFGIASLTKPIVAAQVLLMVEAGEISLDARATHYLPESLTFDTNGATIRDLLSHRSGIPDWYSDAMEAQFAAERTRFWKPEELLALVGPARRPLGTFEYADTNYTLLGMVIEHVRRRPLAAVLRDGALDIPGTERLVYQPDEAPSDPMTMPRGESRDAIEQGGGYLSSRSDTSDGPAGGMASDTISLARWWRALCAGQVVSKPSLDSMATFYENGELDYGLGLFNPFYQQGSPNAIGHLGSSFGYKAAAGCLVDTPSVFVVLTNDVAIDSQQLAGPLVAALRQP